MRGLVHIHNIVYVHMCIYIHIYIYMYINDGEDTRWVPDFEEDAAPDGREDRPP